MKTLYTTLAVCGLLLASVVSQTNGAWTWTTLDCPLGAFTTLKGVFGNKIVGCYETSTPGRHGFLYDGTTWSTLEPPGALGSDATAICSNGVVGYYAHLSAPPFAFILNDAFVYDGTTYTQLHMPGVDGSLDGFHAIPTGMDGARVIGRLATNDITDPTDQNFVYDGTTRTSLNAPGAQSTVLNGISGSKIVGQYSTNTSGSYGFLYDDTTQAWSTLTFQPTGERVTPYGIDGNSIVGSYHTYAGKQYGFYYDGATWFNLTYPGAQSTFAYAISGNNIVGHYTDAAGMSHGFLLTVPEPVTLSLLAMGGLLIARRRRA